jgi:hypothetical protein
MRRSQIFGFGIRYHSVRELLQKPNIVFGIAIWPTLWLPLVAINAMNDLGDILQWVVVVLNICMPSYIYTIWTEPYSIKTGYSFSTDIQNEAKQFEVNFVRRSLFVTWDNEYRQIVSHGDHRTNVMLRGSWAWLHEGRRESQSTWSRRVSAREKAFPQEKKGVSGRRGLLYADRNVVFFA